MESLEAVITGPRPPGTQTNQSYDASAVYWALPTAKVPSPTFFILIFRAQPPSFFKHHSLEHSSWITIASIEPPFTNLDLVARVDSWPYFTDDPEAYKRHMLDYYYFMVEGLDKPFGYVHYHFLEQMRWPESCWIIDEDKRLLTLIGGADFAARSRLLNWTLRQNHESGKVPALFHWAAELFPLYTSSGEHVLDLDGCGVDMLGIVNYSVHMIGSVMTADGMKLWIPRRATTKMSFPGMLDSTVGGSLASGEIPMDGIIRECEEELCLDPGYTRANIRSCGTISFQLTVTDLLETACQHQVQYLYEMEFRQDVVPRIGDGEVGELQLMSISEVRQAMRDGKFKLTCNMTYLAFLIRHGLLTAEEEPDLVEICSRMHRKHSLFIA